MPVGQKRLDVVESSQDLAQIHCSQKLSHLIMLDETAFTTNMHTACGYAPKGERLTVFEPHGHRYLIK